MKKITLLLISLLVSTGFFAQDINVTSFTLVNADTNEDIMEISEGAEINLLEYAGVEFNIRANTTADAKSVSLYLTGNLTKSITENVAPYAIYGDSPTGNYRGQLFPVGSYAISATPFSAGSAGGTAGPSLSVNFNVIETPLQKPFITTWITDNPGISEDNQITIHTSVSSLVGPYNYSVEWGDGNSDTGVTGDITHTYDTPGIYEISISGKFPAISFGIINGEQKDNLKLFKVNQWGSQKWSDLSGAFDGCANLDVIALDKPDLSEVIWLAHMFRGCQSLVFNDSINNWDVSNVTHMWSMFSSCSAFNQDISNWDVGNVVRMDGMFNFSRFNQNIGNWNVSQVTSMNQMFFDTPFNQDIGDWDVTKVTDMSGMFRLTPFNQDIGKWTVGNVTDMSGMFDMNNAFDQDLGSWNVGKVTFFDAMFKEAELSTENYDALFNGWMEQQLQSGVTFDGGNSQYCLGEEARQKLIDDFGWNITDGGKAEDCADITSFITTWKTDNPGNSEDNQITIPTHPNEPYNYRVEWGDGSSNLGVKGNITHTYETPGTYQVSISGDFPRIYFNDDDGSDDIAPDYQKLLLVNQWGDIAWSSMGSAFTGCSNLDVIAEDTPDLSNVTDMSNMLNGCLSLVGTPTFKNWDVSTITNMGAALSSALVFNQDISTWDTSSVTTMAALFFNTTSFNRDISSWNTASVSDMSLMFFNATSFDQDIRVWNVDQVTTMESMFERAFVFNQDIGGWNIENVSNMTKMFNETGLSIANYDSTLNGWSAQQLQNGVIFDGGNSMYCLGEPARQLLIDVFGWTITDGGLALNCIPCPFEQITLNTQQQIDEFAITYDVANCTFEGGILIEGTDIYNLDGLSTLTDIDGFFSIVNTSLTNIDELSSLTNARGGLLIEGNSVLTNIDGLSTLTNLGTITISENASLANIDGLTSLTSVYSDLVIQNNESLTNLDGLSSLTGISDDFIIKNNATLSNVDGLSSLVFLDNDLIIESNPMLENVDGLSGLDAIGLSLVIKSNAALTNLDGLSAITNMFADLSIVNNDRLTNLAGLSSLISIGGQLNISENNALSDCAIDAVCDSESIVNGTVTITGNTGNCTDVTVAKAACVEVEALANLIEATYLQGSSNPEPNGLILRAEEGNREVYLKFDLSSFSGPITLATLQMQVASDPGNGTLEVFLGSNSNWTETGLNGSNKPVAIGSPLATITGTHSLGQSKTWNLDVSRLTSGGEITLIVKHSSGNDVAFASDETNQAPQLLITSGAVVQRPFITTWKTDNPGISADNQITIPTFTGETYDYTVDWGDGTSDSGVTGDIVHSYTTSGTYQVSISGVFPRINFTADAHKIIEINQWGSTKWSSMESAFAGCINLDVTAIDVPDLSSVTSTQFMFDSCFSLVGNPTFNEWDTSTLVDMSFMFSGTSMFNQPIGQWDTSNVTNMEEVFSLSLFNSDIGNWNTSQVNSMREMFEFSFFNQNISGWNVSQVRDMLEMFQGTAFNQDISQWDVSNVQDMFAMFNGANDFNQDLSLWNISSVNGMGGIFAGSGLSNENYDNILIAWSTLEDLQDGVEFGAQTNQYCQGEGARQKLIDDFGWIITDGGKSSNCVIVEASADLIDATYLQGSNNPEPTGPILRAEEGYREIYLKFELSAFNSEITNAQLEMQVASDPGYGTLEVYLANNSNWTESGLSGSNKPALIGNTIASISGTHSIGQTKTWNLDVSQLPSGGLITLVVRHSSGNDVAFASDETNFAPQLTITSEGSSLNSGANLSGKSTNILSLSPNPAVVETTLSLREPAELVMIYIYDVLGRLVGSYEGNAIESNGAYDLDIQNVPSGTYYIKSYDIDGNMYQKQMVIMK